MNMLTDDPEYIGDGSRLRYRVGVLERDDLSGLPGSVFGTIGGTGTPEEPLLGRLASNGAAKR
jgi:hypothetical protein